MSFLPQTESLTMSVTIRTNNVPRELISGWELTKKERKELDYIGEVNDENVWSNEVNRFFRYRGEIYDIHEFVCIEKRSQLTNSFCHGVDDDSILLKWDGIQTDSFFSAIVVRYTDNENIVVGSYTC